MSKPTVSELYARVRAILDDTGESGGEQYTDATLANFYPIAYAQLADVFTELRIGVFKRVRYFKLDNLQRRAELSDEGISLVSQPQRLREAVIASEYAISGVTNTLPVVITTSATPSGVATADPVYVFGVGGQTAANGFWFASGVAGNDVTIAGGDTSSAYTSGGYLVKISGTFSEMYPVPSLAQEAVATSNREYVFREGAIEVNPLLDLNGRLIEITYFENPTAPTSGEIPVEGSLNFLATQTAALTEESLGNREFAKELFERARVHMRELLAQYQIRDYTPPRGEGRK